MKVPRMILEALSRLANVEPSAYALEQVRIEPDGEHAAIAVATDARALGAVRFLCDNPIIECGVPCELIERMVKSFQDEQVDFIQIRQNNNKVRLQSPGNEVTTCGDVPEGKYPKWRDLWPERGETVSINVNPRLLAKVLLAVADAATDDDHYGVVLEIDSANDVIEIRAKNQDGSEAAAIVKGTVFDSPVAPPDWRPGKVQEHSDAGE